MIKILHTADIHLDAPLRSLALRDESLRDAVQAATRAAFTRTVDVALSERVAALLISGDLFDGRARSARTAAFLTAQLDRLRTADIPVFYIKGNHDAENPITGALDLPDNVHVFDARGGCVQLTDDIRVHGVSFADRHAPDSLLPRFPAPVPGAVNIAMLHTSLAGAAGHDTYAPCTLADLTAMGFDYWALGHVHKRQVHSEAPWVVMPGMPQGRDIGEAGAKSASLLTVDAGRIEVTEVPTSVVEFAATALDISGVDSDDALRAALRDHLRGVADTLTSDAGVIRLTLTGTPPRHWQILRDQDIWAEAVAALARDTGRLWLDKLHLEIDAPGDAARAGSATDELAALMAAIRAEPGFGAAAQAEIEEVIGDLPQSVRATLLPDADAAGALTDSLAATGARRVLARMKGAEG
ncbi:metallophosphoesterase family protein [Roseovarius ramblicola]|uniref:Exonuclease SbcCD subunit D n=1 Tax=Roseovarius ramblicola TaxID=2022336 RepID=A0ABV5HUR7_9RHOB